MPCLARPRVPVLVAEETFRQGGVVVIQPVAQYSQLLVCQIWRVGGKNHSGQQSTDCELTQASVRVVLAAPPMPRTPLQGCLDCRTGR